MSREDYVEVLQDFCEEVGFDDVHALLQNGLVRIDDALIGIEYLEERDEIRLLMDLGEIDAEEDPAALLALLLESNLSNTSTYLPTFSLHPETGHPVIAYHVPLNVLLEEDVGLGFVLEEQLLPLVDEWKAAARQALIEARSGEEARPLPGTLA